MSDSIKNNQEQDSDKKGCREQLLILGLQMLSLPIIMAGAVYLFLWLSNAGYGEELDAASRTLGTYEDAKETLIIYIGIPLLVGFGIYAWLKRGND